MGRSLHPLPIAAASLLPPLLLLVLLLSSRVAAAVESASSPSSDCSISSLTPCLPYITNGNSTIPGKDCCDPMMAATSSCLCSLVSLATGGSSINITRATDLPNLCGMKTPTCPGMAPNSSSSPSSSSSKKGAGSSDGHRAFLAPSFSVAALVGLACYLLRA